MWSCILIIKNWNNTQTLRFSTKELHKALIGTCVLMCYRLVLYPKLHIFYHHICSDYIIAISSVLHSWDRSLALVVELSFFWRLSCWLSMVVWRTSSNSQDFICPTLFRHIRSSCTKTWNSTHKTYYFIILNFIPQTFHWSCFVVFSYLWNHYRIIFFIFQFFEFFLKFCIFLSCFFQSVFPVSGCIWNCILTL